MKKTYLDRSPLGLSRRATERFFLYRRYVQQRLNLKITIESLETSFEACVYKDSLLIALFSGKNFAILDAYLAVFYSGYEAAQASYKEKK